MVFREEQKDIFINNFLAYMEIEKGASKNTIRGYAHDLYSLTEFLYAHKYIHSKEIIEWGNISIFHLRGFLAYLHTQKANKASSIHRRVCSLKGFFKFLEANNAIESDPAKDLSYPKRAKSLPKFLPTTDMQSLLDIEAKTKLHKTIMEVLYSTGARCNEVRNMNLVDIEFGFKDFINDTGETIKVSTGQIIIRGGKGGKDRLVLLTPRAANILKDYINTERNLMIQRAKDKFGSVNADTEEALFLSNRGKRVANRTIQHFISKLSKEAGVRHTTPHMIRHSFASHLVMNKTNIRAIQQLLGHASLDTTQIYANITPDYLRSEFDGNLPIK